jgi:SAM-dependent methyltransferase
MDFYDGEGSLFVKAYDALYSSADPQLAPIVAFYERVAREVGGGVLEVACGTGRFVVPLARTGLHVTGVDRSAAMMAVARRKLAKLPAAVQERVTLVEQDMTALSLDRRFGFISVPARSLQHLLTVDLQRASLAAIRRHIEPNGRIALHLFDPRHDLLVDANAARATLSGIHPETGRRYVGEVVRTDLDHVNQVRRDLWRYTEIGRDGEVLAEDTREMTLRWTYRFELHHLLELCGFAVEAEYSDFVGSAPAYGKELIVIGRAR